MKQEKKVAAPESTERSLCQCQLCREKLWPALERAVIRAMLLPSLPAKRPARRILETKKHPPG